MLRFVLNRCVEDGDEGSFPTLGRLTDLLSNDDDVVGTSPADENIANNNTNNNNSSTEALPQVPSASTEEKAVDTAKKKAATSSSMLAFMLEHCLDADEEARIVFPSLMRLERMMQDDELSHLPPPPPPPQTNAPTTTTPTTTTQSLSTEEVPMTVAVPTLVSASMPPMAAPHESKMEENILTQHDAQQTAASMLEVPPPPPHGDVSASTRLSSKSSPQHSSRGQLTTGDLVAQTCGGVRPTGCATLGQLALMPASNPLMPAEEAEVLEEPTTTTSSEAAAKVHLQLLPSVVDGETSDSAEEDAVEQLYRHHPTEPPYEEGASRSSIYTASDFSSALPRSCASSTTQAPAQTPPSTKVRAAAAVARSRSTTNNKKDRPPVAQKQQQQQQQPTGSWLVGGAPPRTTAAAALSRRGRTVREEVHRATCLRALDLANTYRVPLSRKFVGAGRNGVDRPNFADRFHQRLYEREVVEESEAHTHNGVEEPARRRSVDPLTRYYGRTILEFNLAEYERGVRRARGRCPPSVVGHDAQTISPEHMTNGNGSQTSAEPLMSVRDHAHPHPSRSTSTPRPHGKGRSRSPRQRGGNRRADASLERMMVVGHNMGPTSLYPRRAIPH